MPNKTYRDMTVAIDNASGTLTALACFVNQASISSTLSVLDDTALCDNSRSTLPDISSSQMPVNGFINSTTDAIWGPLIGNRTSITKTAEFYDGVSYYRGEFWPENVQISGGVGALVTWSVTLTLDGTITKTSVTAVS